jgi:hypothetical protein
MTPIKPKIKSIQGLTLIGLLLNFVFTSCESNHAKTDDGKFEEQINYEKEKEAILDVIENESKAFWKKDFEEYASFWVHEDYIRTHGWWEAGGVTVVSGWEERGKRTKSHMENSPEENSTATTVKRENINLRIYEDVAWMTFDQYGEDTGDPTMDMPGLSRETRILEKHNGKWKIVYVSWLLEG